MAMESKKTADREAARIGLKHSNLLVLLLTGNSPEAIKGSLEDANYWWAQYDIILFTPVVGSGVSFDVRDHVGAVFGCFSASGTTAEFASQQCRRIRHPQNATLRVCFQGKPRNVYLQHLPTTASEVRTALVNNQNWMTDAQNTKLAAPERPASSSDPSNSYARELFNRARAWTWPRPTRGRWCGGSRKINSFCVCLCSARF